MKYIINNRISRILNKLGIDSRAERTQVSKRPDIRCFYRGLIIGIESSYNKWRWETLKRIKEGLVDACIALYLREKYPDASEDKLDKLIERSKFDVKLFILKEIPQTLINWITEKFKTTAEPVTRLDN